MSYNIYGEMIFDGHMNFGFSSYIAVINSNNDYETGRTEINNRSGKYVVDGYSFGTTTEAVNYLMSDGMTYKEAIDYLENEGGAF